MLDPVLRSQEKQTSPNGSSRGSYGETRAALGQTEKDCHHRTTAVKPPAAELITGECD
jgi:hypothetical protein